MLKNQNEILEKVSSFKKIYLYYFSKFAIKNHRKVHLKILQRAKNMKTVL